MGKISKTLKHRIILLYSTNATFLPRFSINSEAPASELIENLDGMFPVTYSSGPCTHDWIGFHIKILVSKVFSRNSKFQEKPKIFLSLVLSVVGPNL